MFENKNSLAKKKKKSEGGKQLTPRQFAKTSKENLISDSNALFTQKTLIRFNSMILKSKEDMPYVKVAITNYESHHEGKGRLSQFMIIFSFKNEDQKNDVMVPQVQSRLAN